MNNLNQLKVKEISISKSREVEGGRAIPTGPVPFALFWLIKKIME